MRNVRVVLAEPRDGRNVGAVCRAMKTMGLTELSIVLSPSRADGPPRADAPQLDLEGARILAVHAADVLDNASYHRDLKQAVRDASLVAGVTRRTGKRRKTWSMTPEELAERVAAVRRGTVALVFGNEEAGLSDEELALCHVAVHIPTSPAFPSLNLSHAVQVIAYALYRRSGPGALAGFTPIRDEQLEELVAGIVTALHDIGFQTQEGSRGMATFLRDILARAQLSAREARRLAGLFRNIRGMVVRARSARRPGGGSAAPGETRGA